MRPSASYLFFYLSNARRFYSSVAKLCSLINGLTNKSYNVIELQCAPMRPTIKLLVNGEAL